ncbi:MAG: hypothetical protein Q9169_008187 [Polycauliona sp. 2 TL-2023]
MGHRLTSIRQYALAAILMALSAYLGDRYHVRGPILVANSLVALIGLPIMGFAASSGARYFGVFLVTAGVNANIPTALAYQANNVRGQWKRAFCSALFVGFGGIGGISGGTIFRNQDAPSYALNFTKSPYRTSWVSLPEVSATRKKLGIPAVRKHADGSDFLTLPILFDPTTTSAMQQEGAFVGDSFDIAVHLHKKSSALDEGRSPLFPPNTLALHRVFNAHVDNLFTFNGVLLAGYYMPLDPATAEATKADMVRRIGLSSWEEFNVPMGTEQRKTMLANFEAALGSGLAVWFVNRDQGPFLEGKMPMYADMIIGGWLQMMRNCLPEWEELRGWHGGLWGKLHDALEEWAQVS